MSDADPVVKYLTAATRDLKGGDNELPPHESITGRSRSEALPLQPPIVVNNVTNVTNVNIINSEVHVSSSGERRAHDPQASNSHFRNIIKFLHRTKFVLITCSGVALAGSFLLYELRGPSQNIPEAASLIRASVSPPSAPDRGIFDATGSFGTRARSCTPCHEQQARSQ